MPDTPKPTRAFLFSLREDGSPTCHPMTGLEKDGAPVFNTYRKSAKAQNLMRDPRAAALLLRDWSAAPSTAQCVMGVAEETAPPEQTAQIADTLGTEGAAKRARERVADGKRFYVRLKAR